jgi:hypothetical protein
VGHVDFDPDQIPPPVGCNVLAFSRGPSVPATSDLCDLSTGKNPVSELLRAEENSNQKRTLSRPSKESSAVRLGRRRVGLRARVLAVNVLLLLYCPSPNCL